MNGSSDEFLQNARRHFEQGQPQKAKILLQEILPDNLDSEEIKFAIKCADFWTEPVSQLEFLASDFERGSLLIAKWQSFQNEFLPTQKRQFEPYIHSIKRGTYLSALRYLSGIGEERDLRQKAEILRRIGLCHKRLGDYDKALQFLQDANSTLQGLFAEMIAEMADCYALSGDDMYAKLMFKEAFRIDAQKIRLDWLDSELIRRLVHTVRAEGYSGAQLLEWIPVYGRLYGVLNQPRELRSAEAGQLKQEVYTKENEYKNPACDASLLVPKLINLYFWLMDYYSSLDGGEARINEIMLKIKLLSPEIHAKLQ